MRILNKIRKNLFYSKYKIFRKLRIFLNIDQTLIINNNKLILPPDHLLSLYEKIYPNYDKFLEKLVMNKKNLSIIDIGANIGDTLFRILRNNRNNYYCIEANNFFLKYLKKNIRQIKYKFKNTKIKVIEELVGSNLEGFLDNSNGTATLKSKSKISRKIYSKKLDKIILENGIKKIDIIKSDTDGYDINVLRSGLKSIKKYKPILFFEYLNIDSKQADKYLDFLKELKIINYCNFFFYDNYGNLIYKKINFKKIKKILVNRKVVDIYCSVKN